MEIIAEIHRFKWFDKSANKKMHVHDFHFSGPPQPPGLTKRLDFENYKSKMDDIENSKSKKTHRTDKIV